MTLECGEVEKKVHAMAQPSTASAKVYKVLGEPRNGF